MQCDYSKSLHIPLHILVWRTLTIRLRNVRNDFQLLC